MLSRFIQSRGFNFFSLWFLRYSLEFRKCTGKTEITKLSFAVLVYENVGRLYISVQYVSAMNILCSTDYSISNQFDMLFFKVYWTFYQSPNVTLSMLHNNTNLRKILWSRWDNNFLQFNNVRMVQALQNCHFSQQSFRVLNLLEKSINLLYRHPFLCLCVYSLAN